jgi:hypothetical protein
MSSKYTSPKTAPLRVKLRLLCTDFDGTLADSDANTPIWPEFFERLLRWRREGPLYWVINTGRTYESLHEELVRRNAPVWPDWTVVVEREIWLVRERRAIGWFEWNRKCELLHSQLFASVKPVWKHIEDFIQKETNAKLVEETTSPIGIIASCEEEADFISSHVEPLLAGYPALALVRNSIYFRFSHRLYNKGTCLEAISQGLNVQPYEIMVVGDHLPLQRRGRSEGQGAPQQRLRGQQADRPGNGGSLGSLLSRPDCAHGPDGRRDAENVVKQLFSNNIGFFLDIAYYNDRVFL